MGEWRAGTAGCMAQWNFQWSAVLAQCHCDKRCFESGCICGTLPFRGRGVARGWLPSFAGKGSSGTKLMNELVLVFLSCWSIIELLSRFGLVVGRRR
jgi:hypothetical protein